MPLDQKRPVTPAQRFRIAHKKDVSKKRPERSLTEFIHKSGGRNCYGRITSRRRGGGHKRLYRKIDFNRRRFDDPAKVTAIEYDPNRTANIALIEYGDGTKSYIIAPRGLKEGDTVLTSEKKVDFTRGNNMPLRVMPPSLTIHCIEMIPGRGAKLARSAGSYARLVAIEGDKATLKMPSGEIRMVHADCRATVGEVGNHEHMNESVGKAGRTRWKGRRPRVRGVAMNPVDHPMGGGEGRTSGGGHPVSPWGQLAKGKPTRTRSKTTNKMILVRRDGRRVKK